MNEVYISGFVSGNPVLKMEKENEISEDDRKQGEEKIQKITDKMITKVDAAIDAKTKEIMTV